MKPTEEQARELAQQVIDSMSLEDLRTSVQEQLVQNYLGDTDVYLVDLEQFKD